MLTTGLFSSRLSLRSLTCTRYREMDHLHSMNVKSLQIANFEISSAQKIERKSKQVLFAELYLTILSFFFIRINLKASSTDMKQLYWNDNAALQTCLTAKWNSGNQKPLLLWKLKKIEKPGLLVFEFSSPCLVLTFTFRIMERAYALKDARDSEREKYVRECYNRQWRDACDDARSLDSAALTVHMSNERIAQIEDKKRRKIVLTIEEQAFVEAWKQQLQVLEEKDRSKTEARLAADRDMQRGVVAQVMNSPFFNIFSSVSL